MKLTVTDARMDGEWLCLKAAEPSPARAFVLDRKPRLYECELRERREKRSLDANAYYWQLCGELARAIREKPEEVYRRHIRDIGNYSVYCMKIGAAEDFGRLWASGHLGRFVETRASKLPGCITVLAYYGSSDFNRAEMSALIDACIQDCKAVGIETLPPDKLELLKDAWETKREG